MVDADNLETSLVRQVLGKLIHTQGAVASNAANVRQVPDNRPSRFVGARKNLGEGFGQGFDALPQVVANLPHLFANLLDGA